MPFGTVWGRMPRGAEGLLEQRVGPWHARRSSRISCSLPHHRATRGRSSWAAQERAGGGRGSWYWRAYRKRYGRLHRFYLGPDADLTPAALTAAVAALDTSQTVTQEGGRLPPEVPNVEPQGSETDGAPRILRAKVAPPVLRPGLVARPALVTRMRISSALTLLIAPAGFGKTTLLAQGFASAPGVAWLMLERSDDAPRDFLVALCAALARVRPAMVSNASVLLHLPAPADPAHVLDQLLGALADCSEPCTIVLDDYHVVASHLVHQLVARLVEQAPPTLHVVIASRAEPPLPLARLRARGLLVELRDRDLRFGGADAAKLLRSASRHALSDADAATLTARTEGWAAGLQLAALALGGAADQARVIAAFTGEHRLVADYLLSEVLAELPPRLRRFLQATAMGTGAGPRRSSCWRSWSSEGCSWRRWTTPAAGIAITSSLRS
jgi:LuxR family transcriptional regulator, maltose regulon positive regulatory protein